MFLENSPFVGTLKQSLSNLFLSNFVSVQQKNYFEVTLLGNCLTLKVRKVDNMYH